MNPEIIEKMHSQIAQMNEQQDALAPWSPANRFGERKAASGRRRPTTGLTREGIALRWLLQFICALMITCGLSIPARAGALPYADEPPILPIGSPAPDFCLPGVDGKTHCLRDYAQAKLLVVIFTCNHCPTAQLYETRVEKLVADYQDHDVAFVAINPNNPDAIRLDELGYTDLSDSFEEMKIRAAYHHFSFPYLYDGATQEVSRAYGPTATPHLFIFDSDRRLRYEGRVDNNPRQQYVTREDARLAIDELLAGKPVAVPRTPAVGCSTKWIYKEQSRQEAITRIEQQPVTVKPVTAPDLKALHHNSTGKLLLVDFWATWCGPCLEEIPQLETMYRMYGHRRFDLVTVSINLPDEQSAVLKKLQDLHATSTNLQFGSTDIYNLMQAFDPKWDGGVPHTVLIAPDGEVVYHSTGLPDAIELRRLVVANIPDDDYMGLEGYWRASVYGDVSPEKSAQIDALMAPWSKGDTPGAAVMVMEDGRIVHEKGYGLANIETREPITPQTMFDLASFSKQFTAMAVMMLAERGKLSLDDPLSKFFPEFPPYASGITVRNLLNHTSGLPDYMELFVKAGKIARDPKPGGFEPTSRDALALLAQQPKLLFDPGTKWEYSNSGYVVLAQIVEKASGERFPDFMKQNIFQPLGMTHTLVMDESRPRIPNRATSYNLVKGAYQDADYDPLDWVYGDGNVNTCLEDLAKWDQALYAEQLVKRETLEQAWTSGLLKDGSETGYGFGWGVGYYLGLPYVGHNGAWVGFRTGIMRFPEQRFTVIVLSNLGQFQPPRMTRKITKIYLGDKLTFPKSVAVSPAVVEKYAGRYELAPQLILNVTFEDGALYVAQGDEEKQKLVPETNWRFFLEDAEDREIGFDRDTSGNVKGLWLSGVGGTRVARRLP